MTRINLVQHYRHLRGIAAEIQEAALALVQDATFAEHGRRLGMARIGEIWVSDPAEMKLVQDLAIHTARPGRSRAIDRYARIAGFPSDSDAARILAPLRQAQMTLFKAEARHPVAGIMAHDLLLKRSFHFMDVSVGLSAKAGDCFAGRLVEIDGFRMSCLTLVPATRELMEAANVRPLPFAKNSLSQTFQDARFAIALYRAAIELGFMRRTVSFDVVKEVPTAKDVAAILAVNDHQPEDLPLLTAAG